MERPLLISTFVLACSRSGRGNLPGSRPPSSCPHGTKLYATHDRTPGQSLTTAHGAHNCLLSDERVPPVTKDYQPTGTDRRNTPLFSANSQVAKVGDPRARSTLPDLGCAGCYIYTTANTDSYTTLARRWSSREPSQHRIWERTRSTYRQDLSNDRHRQLQQIGNGCNVSCHIHLYTHYKIPRKLATRNSDSPYFKLASQCHLPL
jgi:hypothetical protein